MPEYNKLITELRDQCNNRSELSGERSDWRSDYNAEPHHIMGRIGKDLINPFNIIFLTSTEHAMQDKNGYEEKRRLLEYIRPIREKQGYQ